MHNFKICISLLLALVLFSICDAKGGRGGGGRGGSHSSGRSSSGSRRGSVSSISSSSSRGSSFGNSHSSGGGTWVHGFFHSSPHYSYRPVFITRSSSSVNSGSSGVDSTNYAPTEEYSQGNDESFAIGYAISRGLSGDFVALYNMIRGISKYPDKIKNNVIIQATPSTESPVATYTNSNFIYN